MVKGFLGNHKVPNFKNIVKELVNAYEKDCRMLLKLHSHIVEFKDNLGDYSEEQGERFHQDVKSFEERHKGQYNENMTTFGIFCVKVISRTTDSLERKKFFE